MASRNDAARPRIKIQKRSSGPGRKNVRPSGPPDRLATLIKAVRDSIAPQNLFESIWAEEFAQLQAEAEHLRRIRAAYFKVARIKGATKLLDQLLGPSPQYARIALDWVLREPVACALMEEAMKIFGGGMEGIDAQTLVSCSAELDALDRMIQRAVARRDAILREIARHRETILIPSQTAQKTTSDAGPLTIEPLSAKETEEPSRLLERLLDAEEARDRVERPLAHMAALFRRPEDLPAPQVENPAPAEPNTETEAKRALERCVKDWTEMNTARQHLAERDKDRPLAKLVEQFRGKRIRVS